MNRRSRILALLLAGLGAIGVSFRHASVSRAPVPSDSALWSVEYNVRFRPRSVDATCRVVLPASGPGVTVEGETISTQGLVLELVEESDSSQRELRFRTIPGAERVRLRARVDLRVRSNPGAASRRGTLTAEPDEPLEGLRRSWLSEVAPALRADSAAAAEAFVNRCREEGLEARPVIGLSFADDGTARPRCWVEASGANGQAVVIDPCRDAGEPATLLHPVARDRTSFVRFRQVRDPGIRVAVEPHPSSRGSRDDGSVWSLLDFTLLPSDLADTVALVLLLPLGGLITSSFRRFLKVSVFGYFTTSLLALSFVHTPWEIGIVVFAVIVALGLLGRLLLSRLRIVKLPRLSLVLIVVVTGLALTVAVLDRFDLSPTSRGVLLPMVCLTMMIERFHVNAKKKGYEFAFKRFFWTVVVAGICLAVFRLDFVRWAALFYPEAQLFVASGLILVGRVYPEGSEEARVKTEIQDIK